MQMALQESQEMDNPILLGLLGKLPMGGFPYFFLPHKKGNF